MLLSEMIQVKMDTEFGVEIFDGKFKFTQRSGHERLYHKSGSGEWAVVDAAWMLHGVIDSAPSGIIHLPPPLTDEQREQLKALYTLGYRWLAKDENGATYAYDKQKLAKGLTVWLNQERGCSRIHDGMAEDVIIPLVSWSDPEPYDIGKALGVKK